MGELDWPKLMETARRAARSVVHEDAPSDWVDDITQEIMLWCVENQAKVVGLRSHWNTFVGLAKNIINRDLAKQPVPYGDWEEIETLRPGGHRGSRWTPPMIREAVRAAFADDGDEGMPVIRALSLVNDLHYGRLADIAATMRWSDRDGWQPDKRELAAKWGLKSPESARAAANRTLEEYGKALDLVSGEYTGQRKVASRSAAQTLVRKDWHGEQTWG